MPAIAVAGEAADQLFNKGKVTKDIGNALSGHNDFKGTPYQADTNAFQYQSGYGNAQQTEQHMEQQAQSNRDRQQEYDNQQRSLYNSGNAALGESDADRNAQQQALGMMQQRAQGQNLISNKIAAQQAGQMMAGQQSLAGSARGPAALALAQQNAAENIGAGQAQIAGQAGINAAQEQLQNEQSFGSMASGMRGQDISQAGTAFGASGTMGGLGIQSGNLGLQYENLGNNISTTQLAANQNLQDLNAGQYSNAQDINAGVTASNAAGQERLMNGVIGAGQNAGGAMAGAMAGGSDPLMKQDITPITSETLPVQGAGAGGGAGGTGGSDFFKQQNAQNVGDDPNQKNATKQENSMFNGALNGQGIGSMGGGAEGALGGAGADAGGAGAMGAGMGGLGGAGAGAGAMGGMGAGLGALAMFSDPDTKEEVAPTGEGHADLSKLEVDTRAFQPGIGLGGGLQATEGGHAEQAPKVSRYSNRPVPLSDAGKKALSTARSLNSGSGQGPMGYIDDPAGRTLMSRIGAHSGRHGLSLRQRMEELQASDEKAKRDIQDKFAPAGMDTTPVAYLGTDDPRKTLLWDESGPHQESLGETDRSRPSLAGQVPSYSHSKPAERAPDIRSAEPKHRERQMTPDEMMAEADRQIAGYQNAMDKSRPAIGGEGPAPWLQQYMADVQASDEDTKKDVKTEGEDPVYAGEVDDPGFMTRPDFGRGDNAVNRAAGRALGWYYDKVVHPTIRTLAGPVQRMVEWVSERPDIEAAMHSPERVGFPHREGPSDRELFDRLEERREPKVIGETRDASTPHHSLAAEFKGPEVVPEKITFEEVKRPAIRAEMAHRQNDERDVPQASDPRGKVLGGVHDNEVAEVLDATPAVSYRYKDAHFEPNAQRPGERQVGFLTSDLKKTPLGASVVEVRPDGYEGYNQHRMIGLEFAGLRNLHERLRDIESIIAEKHRGGKER